MLLDWLKLHSCNNAGLANAVAELAQRYRRNCESASNFHPGQRVRSGCLLRKLAAQ